MTARRPCPDAALLAAFIDGALVDYERTAVIAHLAECDECRAIATSVIVFNEQNALDDLWHMPAIVSSPIEVPKSRVRRWSTEKTRAPAVALAIAAALVTIAVSAALLVPSWSSRRAVSTLVDASAGQRPIEARLSGGFHHALPPSPNKPSGGGWQLISAAGRIRDAYEDDPAIASRQVVGVAALLTGQLDDAVANLSMAAATLSDQPAVLNDLAAAYYQRATTAARADDLPRALSVIERALAVAPDSAESWFNRALIISALGLRAQARTAWQAYLDHDATSPWADEARERRESLGPPPTVIADWTTLRAKLQDRADQATADEAVGRHTSRTRDFIERDLLSAWVVAAENGDDQEAVLRPWRALGEAFARLSGDRLYAEAVETIDRVRAGGSRIALAKLAVAHKEYLRGARLMAAPAFAKAAPVLARADSHLAAFGSPLALRARIELAATDYFAGRLDEADRALSPVKAEARGREFAILVTRAAWVQGIVAFERGDYGNAQLAYEEMFEAARVSGDIDQQAFGQALLANLHDTLGNASQAWRYRVDAAKQLEEIFQPNVPAAVFLGAAGDATASGNYAAALTFQSALLAVSALNPAVELQARAQRARTLHHLGRFSDATHAVDHLRQLLGEVQDPQLHLRVEVDVLMSEAEILETVDRPRALAAAERALTLPNIGRDKLRLARLNLLLAEGKRAQGDVSGAQRAIDHGVEALEAFQDEPSAALRLRTSDPSWSLYVEGMELALQRGDVARAFQYSERRRIRTAYERRSWGSTVLSIEAIQSRLDADTAVAILNQLDDHLQVWVLRRDAVTGYSAAITKARAAGLVATHLQEMKRAVAAPTASAELFDALLRPAGGLLNGARRLVMVTDVPYHRVAFAGLWDRKQNQYVVEGHTVASAPSATAVAWGLDHRPRANDGPTRAVVFESPSRDGVMPPSVGVHDLDHSLAAFYRGAQLRRGDAATPSQLFIDGHQRDVVHVAAQIVGNDEFPFLSRVMLADEPGHKYSGSVFARHVAGDDVFRARLVALETSVGQSATPRAEGPLGFVRALLAGGVQNVVGPVAEVRAADLGRIWLDFHRHYASGSAAADSLRRAQLAALRESNHRPGPWAMVTVFGSTE